MNKLLTIFMVFGLTLGMAAGAVGMAPPFLTDAQLSKYPVIVIAKWEKAPFVWNRSPDDPAIDKIEAFTRLRILEVIRGDVTPGEALIMTGWGIGWNKEGTELRTHTSSDLLGDVDDVTKPAIWFFKRKRSWDKSRKEEYLSVTNYREVQPIELKDFYAAMTREDADQVVPTLLSMERTLISQRVLRHLCGGIRPWPFDEGTHGSFYRRPKERGKVYREEAGRVWEFVKANPGKPRPMSVAAYAELAGKDCVSHVRTLLDDADSQVRLVAIGVLARHRDGESVGGFAKAATGFTGAWETCLVLEELAKWDDPRLVPTLFRFLQNDHFAYSEGDKYGVPALLAQIDLRARTAHAFPFDVELAEKAWRETSKIRDKAARLRLLRRLAPEEKAPIIATAVGSPSKELGQYLWKGIDHLESHERVILVQLWNPSSRPVVISKQPWKVNEHWEGGSDGYRTEAIEAKPEFVTIKPMDIGRLEVRVSTKFLEAAVDKRELTLSYLADGRDQGLKAWTGEMTVVVGERFEP